MKLPGFLSGVHAFLMVEVLLFAALVAIGGAGLLLSQSISQAKDKQVAVERRLSQARNSLVSIKLDNEKGRLTAQLEQLKAQRIDDKNLSRQEALNMASALAAYIARRGFRLHTFSKEDTVLTLGETTQRALILSLKCEGSAEDLLGLLGLIDSFPGPALQSLGLTRSATGEGLWEAQVGVLLTYEGGP